MLSTAYRLRLEDICNRIAKGQNVNLNDIIWVEKLSRANRTAFSFLRQARRKAANPNMVEGSLDDFLNTLDLGDPDPSNHKSGFNSPEKIADFFKRDDLDGEWRRRD